MTVTTQELRTVRRRLGQRQEAHQRASEAEQEAVREQAEAKRRKQEAEAEKRRLRQRAEEERLLGEPGGGTKVAPEVAERLQVLDGTIAELDTRVETRRKAKREAREALREAAVEYTRAVRERRMEHAAPRYRRGLEGIGEAAAESYREHQDAKDELAALDGELKRGASLADADGRQLSRLRAAVRRGDRDLSGAALLGWCVVEAIRWARHFDEGPLAEYLEEAGIEPVSGSPRHGKPFGALEDIVAAIEQARLPGGTTRI